jgi:6-pyruvoyl-tetrahydropterin synthase related domain
MAWSPGRERLADALGLLLLTLALVDYFRPALLFLPTITAGGDTPCHYPTAVWFHEHLLPKLRLHGWYPGSYLGHPLLLYYFPLPFLLMSAFAPVTGMPVAFKLGTALPTFLLPILAYASFRLMRFRFPAPLLGAGASYVFLMQEENPIWGGTIASTMTGEFSYGYGIALAVLFLGFAYRSYADGRSPWGPAALLGLTALAHGYAVLWAGLATTFFLYDSRKPVRTLGWLAAVGALAFGFAAFMLLPLLSAWGWTTPYDDPWITVTTLGLAPSLLWPLFAAAAMGIVGTLVLGRRAGGADRRLLFLAHAAAVGAALAAAGPAAGVIDVRFVPFAQLALCLVGGASIGLAAARLRLREVAAIGLLLLAVAYGDARSRVVRFWFDWNYTGLEGKELWPAFREMTDSLRGDVADSRVAVEYGAIHEKAGSIRMYETLPLFSGRSTLEGVYNQASVSTHPVYYLASELFASSPNPFRKRTYSRFDPESALRRLPLFAVGDVVTVSDRLSAFLEGRKEAALVARIPPYKVFHLAGDGGGYVVPLRYAPVRSSPAKWEDKAYRWFSSKPLHEAFLVFTEDTRFETVETDEWAAPPLVPLPDGVEVRSVVKDEEIEITTSRPGHPLLVKVSYHPRWRAVGADGPWLVSPSLMLVIPRETKSRLVYAGRDGSDHLGLALTGLTLVLGIAFLARRRAPSSPIAPVPVIVPERSPVKWGGVIPGLILVLLVAARFLPTAKPDPTLRQTLYERASEAIGEDRFEDAAEYARHALDLETSSSLRAELLCLRGEALLRAGHPREAAYAFQEVVDTAASSPYLAQALFSGAEAKEAMGDTLGAAADRLRLRRDLPLSPWAQRLPVAPPSARR